MDPSTAAKTLSRDAREMRIEGLSDLAGSLRQKLPTPKETKVGPLIKTGSGRGSRVAFCSEGIVSAEHGHPMVQTDSTGPTAAICGDAPVKSPCKPTGLVREGSMGSTRVLPGAQKPREMAQSNPATLEETVVVEEVNRTSLTVNDLRMLRRAFEVPNGVSAEWRPGSGGQLRRSESQRILKFDASNSPRQLRSVDFERFQQLIAPFFLHVSVSGTRKGHRFGRASANTTTDTLPPPLEAVDAAGTQQSLVRVSRRSMGARFNDTITSTDAQLLIPQGMRERSIAAFKAAAKTLFGILDSDGDGKVSWDDACHYIFSMSSAVQSSSPSSALRGGTDVAGARLARTASMRSYMMQRSPSAPPGTVAVNQSPTAVLPTSFTTTAPSVGGAYLLSGSGGGSTAGGAVFYSAESVKVLGGVVAINEEDGCVECDTVDAADIMAIREIMATQSSKEKAGEVLRRKRQRADGVRNDVRSDGGEGSRRAGKATGDPMESFDRDDWSEDEDDRNAEQRGWREARDLNATVHSPAFPFTPPETSVSYFVPESRQMLAEYPFLSHLFHKGPITHFVAHQNGNTFVTAGSDGQVKLWRPCTVKMHRRLPGGAVQTELAFSLGAAGLESTVRATSTQNVPDCSAATASVPKDWFHKLHGAHRPPGDTSESGSTLASYEVVRILPVRNLLCSSASITGLALTHTSSDLQLPVTPEMRAASAQTEEPVDGAAKCMEHDADRRDSTKRDTLVVSSIDGSITVLDMYSGAVLRTYMAVRRAPEMVLSDEDRAKKGKSSRMTAQMIESGNFPGGMPSSYSKTNMNQMMDLISALDNSVPVVGTSIRGLAHSSSCRSRTDAAFARKAAVDGQDMVITVADPVEQSHTSTRSLPVNFCSSKQGEAGARPSVEDDIGSVTVSRPYFTIAAHYAERTAIRFGPLSHLFHGVELEDPVLSDAQKAHRPMKRSTAIGLIGFGRHPSTSSADPARERDSLMYAAQTAETYISPTVFPHQVRSHELRPWKGACVSSRNAEVQTAVGSPSPMGCAQDLAANGSARRTGPGGKVSAAAANSVTNHSVGWFTTCMTTGILGDASGIRCLHAFVGFDNGLLQAFPIDTAERNREGPVRNTSSSGYRPSNSSSSGSAVLFGERSSTALLPEGSTTFDFSASAPLRPGGQCHGDGHETVRRGNQFMSPSISVFAHVDAITQLIVAQSENLLFSCSADGSIGVKNLDRLMEPALVLGSQRVAERQKRRMAATDARPSSRHTRFRGKRSDGTSKQGLPNERVHHMNLGDTDSDSETESPEAVVSRKLNRFTSLHGHVKEVTCMDWSRANGILVSGGKDGCIFSWSPRSRRPIHSTSLQTLWSYGVSLKASSIPQSHRTTGRIAGYPVQICFLAFSSVSGLQHMQLGGDPTPMDDATVPNDHVEGPDKDRKRFSNAYPLAEYAVVVDHFQSVYILHVATMECVWLLPGDLIATSLTTKMVRAKRQSARPKPSQAGSLAKQAHPSTGRGDRAPTKPPFSSMESKEDGRGVAHDSSSLSQNLTRRVNEEVQKRNLFSDYVGMCLVDVARQRLVLFGSQIHTWRLTSATRRDRVNGSTLLHLFIMRERQAAQHLFRREEALNRRSSPARASRQSLSLSDELASHGNCGTRTPQSHLAGVPWERQENQPVSRLHRPSHAHVPPHPMPVKHLLYDWEQHCMVSADDYDVVVWALDADKSPKTHARDGDDDERVLFRWRVPEGIAAIALDPHLGRLYVGTVKQQSIVPFGRSSSSATPGQVSAVPPPPAAAAKDAEALKMASVAPPLIFVYSVHSGAMLNVCFVCPPGATEIFSLACVFVPRSPSCFLLSCTFVGCRSRDGETESTRTAFIPQCESASRSVTEPRVAFSQSGVPRQETAMNTHWRDESGGVAVYITGYPSHDYLQRQLKRLQTFRQLSRLSFQLDFHHLVPVNFGEGLRKIVDGGTRLRAPTGPSISGEERLLLDQLYRFITVPSEPELPLLADRRIARRASWPLSRLRAPKDTATEEDGQRLSLSSILSGAPQSGMILPQRVVVTSISPSAADLSPYDNVAVVGLRGGVGASSLTEATTSVMNLISLREQGRVGSAASVGGVPGKDHAWVAEMRFAALLPGPLVEEGALALHAASGFATTVHGVAASQGIQYGSNPVGGATERHKRVGAFVEHVAVLSRHTPALIVTGRSDGLVQVWCTRTTLCVTMAMGDSCGEVSVDASEVLVSSSSGIGALGEKLSQSTDRDTSSSGIPIDIQEFIAGVEARTMKELFAFRGSFVPGSSITAFTLSPDQRTLSVGDSNGYIVIIDLSALYIKPYRRQWVAADGGDDSVPLAVPAPPFLSRAWFFYRICVLARWRGHHAAVSSTFFVHRECSQETKRSIAPTQLRGTLATSEKEGTLNNVMERHHVGMAFSSSVDDVEVWTWYVYNNGCVAPRSCAGGITLPLPVVPLPSADGLVDCRTASRSRRLCHSNNVTATLCTLTPFWASVSPDTILAAIGTVWCDDLGAVQPRLSRESNHRCSASSSASMFSVMHSSGGVEAQPRRGPRDAMQSHVQRVLGEYNVFVSPVSIVPHSPHTFPFLKELHRAYAMEVVVEAASRLLLFEFVQELAYYLIESRGSPVESASVQSSPGVANVASKPEPGASLVVERAGLVRLCKRLAMNCLSTLYRQLDGVGDAMHLAGETACAPGRRPMFPFLSVSNVHHTIEILGALANLAATSKGPSTTVDVALLLAELVSHRIEGDVAMASSTGVIFPTDRISCIREAPPTVGWGEHGIGTELDEGENVYEEEETADLNDIFVAFVAGGLGRDTLTQPARLARHEFQQRLQVARGPSSTNPLRHGIQIPRRGPDGRLAKGDGNEMPRPLRKVRRPTFGLQQLRQRALVDIHTQYIDASDLATNICMEYDEYFLDVLRKGEWPDDGDQSDTLNSTHFSPTNSSGVNLASTTSQCLFRSERLLRRRSLALQLAQSLLWGIQENEDSSDDDDDSSDNYDALGSCDELEAPSVSYSAVDPIRARIARRLHHALTRLSKQSAQLRQKVDTAGEDRTPSISETLIPQVATSTRRVAAAASNHHAHSSQCTSLSARKGSALHHPEGELPRAEGGLEGDPGLSAASVDLPPLREVHQRTQQLHDFENAPQASDRTPSYTLTTWVWDNIRRTTRGDAARMFSRLFHGVLALSGCEQATASTRKASATNPMTGVEAGRLTPSTLSRLSNVGDSGVPCPRKYVGEYRSPSESHGTNLQSGAWARLTPPLGGPTAIQTASESASDEPAVALRSAAQCALKGVLRHTFPAGKSDGAASHFGDNSISEERIAVHSRRVRARDYDRSLSQPDGERLISAGDDGSWPSGQSGNRPQDGRFIVSPSKDGNGKRAIGGVEATPVCSPSCNQKESLDHYSAALLSRTLMAWEAPLVDAEQARKLGKLRTADKPYMHVLQKARMGVSNSMSPPTAAAWLQSAVAPGEAVAVSRGLPAMVKENVNFSLPPLSSPSQGQSFAGALQGSNPAISFPLITVLGPEACGDGADQTNRLIASEEQARQAERKAKSVQQEIKLMQKRAAAAKHDRERALKVMTRGQKVDHQAEAASERILSAGLPSEPPTSTSRALVPSSALPAAQLRAKVVGFFSSVPDSQYDVGEGNTICLTTTATPNLSVNTAAADQSFHLFTGMETSSLCSRSEW